MGQLSCLHFRQGYFETARSELAPKGISITMLCPGPVFSDILTACATEKPGEVRGLNKCCHFKINTILLASQQLGGKMSEKDRRMNTDRCAKLCAVAIVNKLDEAWISINPVLIFLYVSQYAPSICRR